MANENTDDECVDCYVRIKVVGVGGAGARAVDAMITSDVADIEVIVADTDAAALAASVATTRVLLGSDLTGGVGSGGDPEVGRKAAIEALGPLREALSGAYFVLVVGCLGGGTGTGASPVIASAARELGALTVGVVTVPFAFEGEHRAGRAAAGLALLENATDSTFVLPSEGLLELHGRDLEPDVMFRRAAETVAHCVRGLTDPLNHHGMLCLALDDVKAVLSHPGHARMGVGAGVGEQGAVSAVREAMRSPLFGELGVASARGVLLGFTGGPKVLLRWIHAAAMAVAEAAHGDAEILVQLFTEPDDEESLTVQLFATGMTTDDDGSG